MTISAQESSTKVIQLSYMLRQKHQRKLVVESSGKYTPCLNIMIGLVQLVGSSKAVCVQRSPQGAMLFFAL